MSEMGIYLGAFFVPILTLQILYRLPLDGDSYIVKRFFDLRESVLDRVEEQAPASAQKRAGPTTFFRGINSTSSSSLSDPTLAGRSQGKKRA